MFDPAPPSPRPSTARAARAVFLSALVGASLAAAAPAAAPDVLVVADVTAPEGVDVLPTRERPVHYYILGGMERDIGGSIAGQPPTPSDLMRAELVKALASQHFIETKLGGPIPKIVIVYTWGTATLDTFDTLEINDATGEQTSGTGAFNARDMFKLVGVNKSRKRLTSSADAYDLHDALQTDRYYIFVAALDAAALRQRQKKLLWRTRISIPSRGTSLTDSMSLMLASAAPFFAREEPRPIFVDRNLRRKPVVELGEIQPLGVVPDSTLPREKR